MRGETLQIPVLQYDLDGSLIGEYSSVIEAAKSVGGNQSNITACCRGRQKKSYGSIWRYKEETVALPIPSIRSGVIRQYALSGEFLEEYPSARTAARKISEESGKSFLSAASGILACCKGHTKKACGYQWRFSEDVWNVPQISPYRRSGTKRVARYSPEGDLIACYDSLMDTARIGLKETDPKKISAIAGRLSIGCIRKIPKLIYGSYWRFIPEGEEPSVVIEVSKQE